MFLIIISSFYNSLIAETRPAMQAYNERVARETPRNIMIGMTVVGIAALIGAPILSPIYTLAFGGMIVAMGVIGMNLGRSDLNEISVTQTSASNPKILSLSRLRSFFRRTSNNQEVRSSSKNVSISVPAADFPSLQPFSSESPEIIEAQVIYMEAHSKYINAIYNDRAAAASAFKEYEKAKNDYLRAKKHLSILE